MQSSSDKGVHMAKNNGTHGLGPHPHHALVSIKGKEGRQSSRDLGALFDAIGEASRGRMPRG